MTLLLSIAFLLILILAIRLNAFIALIMTALFAGLSAGMAPPDLLKSIQNGLGSTLGGLALVLSLGILLGSMLAETGAIAMIAGKLLGLLGKKNAGIALALTGFVIGLALFYNAGFVVLAPLVFSIAAQTGVQLTPLAIAMAAPLSVTHGFLPPHPGATAVANAFGADLGKTLLLGLIAAIPAILLAGVYFPKFLKNIPAQPPAAFVTPPVNTLSTMPGIGKSLAIALLPVLLMAVASIASMAAPEAAWLTWLQFIGDPGNALLLAVLCALLFLGQNRIFPDVGRIKTAALMEKSAAALGAAASLLLITAAGGAFKQVLLDSGIGATVAEQFKGVNTSPLLLGWLIATLLRIAIGSATIAGMTAAGIALPIMQQTGASPELMTLAVGAGSLMCSHVNDTGFWMFKEWFGLSLRDTFKSWTVMETIVGVTGLLAVLLMDLII